MGNGVSWRLRGQLPRWFAVSLLPNLLSIVIELLNINLPRKCKLPAIVQRENRGNPIWFGLLNYLILLIFPFPASEMGSSSNWFPAASRANLYRLESDKMPNTNDRRRRRRTCLINMVMDREYLATNAILFATGRRRMWAVGFRTPAGHVYAMHLPWIHRQLTWLSDWLHGTTSYLAIRLRQPFQRNWRARNPMPAKSYASASAPTLIGVQRQKGIIKIVEPAPSDGTISNDMDMDEQKSDCSTPGQTEVFKALWKLTWMPLLGNGKIYYTRIKED